MLVDPNEAKERIKNYILTSLNKYCTAHGCAEELFEAEDINELTLLNQKLYGHRALLVNLKLSRKILESSVSLIDIVVGINEKTYSGRILPESVKRKSEKELNLE